MTAKFLYKYQRNLPCPCESGKKAKNCCFKNNHWNKEPSDISPKLPKTNHVNHKCYAKITANCSRKISREHFVSHDVLKHISQGGKSIQIEGISWVQTGDRKEVSTNSLAVTNLCERHNNALSPLDAEASRFFKILDYYNRGFKESNIREELKVFSGDDLEKWMLKTSIAILESGQIKNDDKPLKLDLNLNCVKMLYGEYGWPKGWGFYVAEETIKYQTAFGFTPIIDRELDKLVGIKFRINNFVFNLGLKEYIDSQKRFGVYRPKTLIFTDGKVKKYIELCWKNESSFLTIDFILNKT